MNKKQINENFLLDAMGTVLVGTVGLLGAGAVALGVYEKTLDTKDKLLRKYKEIKNSRLDKKLEPILKRFAEDPTIQDMYKSLPKYKDPFNAPTDEQAEEQEKLNVQHIEQAKKISEYIKSQLKPNELKYIKNITGTLNAPYQDLNENKTTINKIEKLRSLIRESIQEYIKEIDSAGTTAMYEAKMKACDDAIEKRKKKIEMAESLEEMQGMFDESKMKDLKTEIKALNKQKDKYGKMLEKLNKGKEVVTEEPIVDEISLSENEEEERYDEEGNIDPNGMYDSGGNPLGATDTAIDKAEYDKDPMPMNESFLKMQKLAGVITETQYNQKKKALVKEASIIDKAKSALGAELKTPETFDTEEINGKQLNSDQKDVKNKIIMVLNDMNKNVRDSYYITELTTEKLIDKGLVINMFDKAGSAKKFEEALKKKGLNISSTSKSNTTDMDVGDYSSRPITTTRVTMTITK